MIVFFDFDDTLFDRNKFISALAGRMGLSRDEFLETYTRYFKDKKRPYSCEKHLETLKRQDRWTDVDSFLQDLSDFVHPEAHNLIRKYKTRADRAILLSYGEENFQKIKIQASGLAGYFDEVIVTQDKVAVLKHLISEKEKAIFINDKEEENKEVKRILSNIEVVDVF